MLDDICRGSAVPWGLFVFSLLGMGTRLLKPYYIAIILLGWMVYSGYRLSVIARSHPDEVIDRSQLGYWLGSVMSCVIVPLAWVLIASQMSTF